MFHDKYKLRKIMTTKPALQKMLQGMVNTNTEDKDNHKTKEKNKFHWKNR